MNTLVIYDSEYGNTAKVAGAISNCLRAFGSTKSYLVSNVTTDDLKDVDLVFLGSPTQGGKATESTMQFINELSSEVMSRTKFAVFDTRYEAKEQKKPLQFLMKVIGFASPKMAVALEEKGGTIVADAEGFIVSDKVGPIRSGEIKRAILWAEDLAKSIK